MPSLLGLSALIDAIRQGLTTGGYTLETFNGQKPADLLIQRPDGSRYEARIYIWNVTPGGTNRPDTERRIQLKGSAGQKVILRDDAPTALLGWHEETGVFVRWEAERYEGLMKSPSLQVPIGTLEQAATDGVAHYEKSGDSGVAVAFRPELIGDLLDPGSVSYQTVQATAVSGDPFQDMVDPLGTPSSDVDLSVLDETIGEEEEKPEGAAAPHDDADTTDDREPPPPPKTRSKKAATHLVTERDPSFDRRVGAAYDQRCAFTGLGLSLLDAAHIVPVADAASNDETSNGIALSPTYHRAYDLGMVTFDADGVLYIDFAPLRREVETGRRADAVAFLSPLREHVAFPEAPDRPHAQYVAYANHARGWAGRQQVSVREVRDHLGLGWPAPLP